MGMPTVLSVGGPHAEWQKAPRSVGAWLGLAAVFLMTGCGGGGNGAASTDSPADPSARSVSAESVLEKMFAIYRNCRTYADNAVYRERWVLREDGVVREPPPQMVSVSFERPAKIRIVRRLPDPDGGIAEEVLVVSTGSRMYHALPQFPRQILETVAPITLTGESVAAARHVAQALFFVPLEDSFPQLDLLLSTRPQDDALAADPTPRLLEEAQLGDRTCYRVSLSSNAGQRIYWIDQESFLLRRLDLPSGGVRQALDPFDQLQGFQRWIEFTDATIDRRLPAAAFEMEVPEDAMVVRTWVEGYPGPEPSGPDVSPLERERYAEQLARYEAALAAVGSMEPADGAAVDPAPVVEIAPRSEPKTFQLEEAWRVEELRQPGSLYAMDGPEGRRIFVLDGLTAVAELSVAGALLERHELSVLGNAAIDRPMMTMDADGRPWFAVGGLGQQRVHLFDAGWNHQWSFPEHESPGIGDFLFAPLGDAGSPQLVVGFWGDVGVHAVSLAGTRQWVDRALQQVWALALVWNDGQNPTVWTAHGREVIGRIGPGGPLAPLSVPGRAVLDLTAADLNGDGVSEICGIAFVESGVFEALGLDPTGREIWSYRLPKGEFLQSTGRRIVAARGESLTGWILPASDGSMHFLDADGRPVDAFNTGRAISGVECVEDEGRTLLIVSSPDGVMAWHLKK